MTESGDPTTDDVERAHLKDAKGFSPPVHRLAPASGLTQVIRRFWIPVWSIPPGEVTIQRVLQYPICLIAVSEDQAHFIGPTTGLSTRTLAGDGWVFGVMFQPAAGALVLGRPVNELTDRLVDLETVPSLDSPALVSDLRDLLADDPGDPGRQRAACTRFEATAAELAPVDGEGRLINAVVEYVETHPEVLRVAQVTRRFDLSERTLQRLTARRIGLSPKWLIQRRRLHEAAGVLRSGGTRSLADVAADLGYADQAHFCRDFRTVTGLTPSEFAAEPHAYRTETAQLRQPPAEYVRSTDRTAAADRERTTMTDAPTPPEHELDDAVERPDGLDDQRTGPTPEPLDADGHPVDTGALDRAQEAIDEGHAATREALQNGALRDEDHVPSSVHDDAPDDAEDAPPPPG